MREFFAQPLRVWFQRFGPLHGAGDITEIAACE